MISHQTMSPCTRTTKPVVDPDTFEYLCFEEPDGSFSAYERTTGARETGRSYREALGHLAANFQTGFTFEWYRSNDISYCRIKEHDIVRGTAGSKLEAIGDMMINLAKHGIINLDVNPHYV